MNKFYEGVIRLYEGGDISVGFYTTEDLAWKAVKADLEEWGGPNVEEGFVRNIVVRDEI